MNSFEYEEQCCRRWVEEMVIGHGFCPFAQREFLRNSIRYAFCPGNKSKNLLATLLAEYQFLNDHPEIETTLVIMPQGFTDFHRYLQVLEEAILDLVDEGFEGIYQLASFHPEYCFTHCEVDDPANFTNRSPYPIVHIIREEGLARAIAAYPDVEAVPQRNIDYARSLGFEYLRKQLVQLLS